MTKGKQKISGDLKITWESVFKILKLGKILMEVKRKAMLMIKFTILLPLSDPLIDVYLTINTYYSTKRFNSFMSLFFIKKVGESFFEFIIKCIKIIS